MSDNEYDDEEGEEFSWAEIPTGTKGLRACKRCSLVKGNDQSATNGAMVAHISWQDCMAGLCAADGTSVFQFVNSGCINCPFLNMESDQSRVQDCTTTYFTGLIAMVDPEGSWVGKWQRIGGCRPGMYAIEVVGELPAEVLDFLAERRIPYHCKPPETGGGR